MTPPPRHTISTSGSLWCGLCYQCLSAVNPGEYDGHRWVCLLCHVAALLRIEQAMAARADAMRE